MCSLLSYNNIVIVLFAGDLHVCSIYSYDEAVAKENDGPSSSVQHPITVAATSSS